MAETRTINEEYARIGAELIAEEPSLEGVRLSCARVAYLSSDNPRKSNGRAVLGSCEKVPPKWHWAADYDYLVTVYEPNAEGLTDAQRRILLHHELLHISVEQTEDGGEKYAIASHDVEEFAEIIRLHGVDWDKR